MAKLKPVLQEWEVLAFTGLPKEFPKCRIGSIFSTEYAEFVKCLGSAFYEHIKNCLAVYDCVPFDNTKAYEIGDVVAWNGVLKIAIKGGVGNLPDSREYWETAPRFKADCECLEVIWCNFLGEYLAWAVVRDNLAFMFRNFSPQGIVKALGAKFEAVDLKDFHTIQAAVSREKEKAFINLDHYMQNNNKDGCFDLYKGIAKGCCGDCGCVPDVCGCEDNDCVETNESDYGYQVG